MIDNAIGYILPALLFACGLLSIASEQIDGPAEHHCGCGNINQTVNVEARQTLLGHYLTSAERQIREEETQND